MKIAVLLSILFFSMSVNADWRRYYAGNMSVVGYTNIGGAAEYKDDLSCGGYSQNRIVYNYAIFHNDLESSIRLETKDYGADVILSFNKNEKKVFSEMLKYINNKMKKKQEFQLNGIRCGASGGYIEITSIK